MNFVGFLRIAGRYFWLMLLCGATAATAVFRGTRNEKKEYESYTTVNTGLVSGYTIESGKSKIDYAYNANEIESMLALTKNSGTIEEITLRLLATCLMQTAPSPKMLNGETFVFLKKTFPDSIRQQLVDYGSFENTLNNIRMMNDSEDPENPVAKLLGSPHPHFGLAAIEKGIKSKREGTTDMIRLEYGTQDDPAFCKTTLEILTKVFIERYRDIKEGQSSNVLDFFQTATQESAADLRRREDSLLSFMVTNKIINYYEQTRFIASKKEDLDEMYFSEIMKLAAADSSRRALEAQLEKRVNLPEVNQQLMKQRSSLSSIASRIAQLELKGLDSISKQEQQVLTGSIAELQKQADGIKNNLRTSATAAFAVMYTTEGIEIKSLLGQWLGYWMEAEQTLARLAIFKSRKKDFDVTYSQFAPWGSKLKRIEREIELAEKSYLENLHSYNAARMHRHNVLMATNLRVVEPPKFPTTAKPSKRIMNVIVAFIACFILVLVVGIALELLDGSLRDPENAAEKIGLTLFSAFPKMPKNWQKHRKIDYPALKERALEQLLQRIKIDLKLRRPTQVVRIAIISANEKDGKSTVANWITEQLRSYDYRVLSIQPKSAHTNNHGDDFYYETTAMLFEKQDETDLIETNSDVVIPWHEYQYVITEIPALIKANYPAQLLNQMDVVLFIARANRSWSVADKRSLEVVNQVMKSQDARLIVNAVRVDLLENSLGEIPRKRSVFRRWIKKIVRRNWHRSNS